MGNVGSFCCEETGVQFESHPERRKVLSDPQPESQKVLQDSHTEGQQVHSDSNSQSKDIIMNAQTKKLYFTAEFKAMGDMTKNGLMNKEEFSRLMMLLGFPGGLDNCLRLWKSVKEHGAFMNVDEYISLMDNSSVEESTSMWRKLFAEFDTDGSGFASPDEVKQGLENIGLTVGPKLKDKLYKMDNNKDGKINYSDFLKMQLNQN